MWRPSGTEKIKGGYFSEGKDLTDFIAWEKTSKCNQWMLQKTWRYQRSLLRKDHRIKEGEDIFLEKIAIEKNLFRKEAYKWEGVSSGFAWKKNQRVKKWVSDSNRVIKRSSQQKGNYN